MSIGIGVTTYNRPKIKKLWLENYLKYTQGDNIKLYIAEDTDLDRKGIAARNPFSNLVVIIIIQYLYLYLYYQLIYFDNIIFAPLFPKVD